MSPSLAFGGGDDDGGGGLVEDGGRLVSSSRDCGGGGDGSDGLCGVCTDLAVSPDDADDSGLGLEDSEDDDSQINTESGGALVS